MRWWCEPAGVAWELEWCGIVLCAAVASGDAAATRCILRWRVLMTDEMNRQNLGCSGPFFSKMKSVDLAS